MTSIYSNYSSTSGYSGTWKGTQQSFSFVNDSQPLFGRPHHSRHHQEHHRPEHHRPAHHNDRLGHNRGFFNNFLSKLFGFGGPAMGNNGQMFPGQSNSLMTAPCGVPQLSQNDHLMTAPCGVPQLGNSNPFAMGGNFGSFSPMPGSFGTSISNFGSQSVNGHLSLTGIHTPSGNFNFADIASGNSIAGASNLSGNIESYKHSIANINSPNAHLTKVVDRIETPTEYITRTRTVGTMSATMYNQMYS